jgi:phosphohistidine phosphatase SixA
MSPPVRWPDAGRRRLLGASGALALLQTWPALAQAPASGPSAREMAAFAGLLRQGGCAVLIRHAQTEPGTGDPPGFRLDECRTQRLLSIAGKEESRRIGRWFKSRRLSPSQVLSSQWCRCKETAELAFGPYTEWAALNSTFGQSAKQTDQTRELRERLRQIPEGKFEVWVTHQVNMTHLTDEYASMGEAFLVDKSTRVKGRLIFS